jgi:hypothetical protein
VLGCVLVSCSGTCLNPDCEFPKLKAPIVLTGKSFEQVTCIDKEGTIWTSSTGWNIAQGILVEGYAVGDTIVYAP